MREHRLDLHAGHGVHPRVGVLDVVPVVALEAGDDGRRAAHELVDRIGAYLGSELEIRSSGTRSTATAFHIPAPATRARCDRRSRDGRRAHRHGELERIAGPDSPHPSAGVTICGVRDVLVAFNVDLDSDDLDTARAIATRIRGTADGDDALPGIRALGLRLASRGVAQVSTNIDHHRLCGPARVLQTVARLAGDLGSGVSAAELVGLAPDSCLAPLRYACTVQGVTLHASARASLDDAVRFGVLGSSRAGAEGAVA